MIKLKHKHNMVLLKNGYNMIFSQTKQPDHFISHDALLMSYTINYYDPKVKSCSWQLVSARVINNGNKILDFEFDKIPAELQLSVF